MLQPGFTIRQDKSAKYLQLAEWFAGRIRSGEFAPGERLPSSRKLASQLKLSAITITAAMDELIRRRLIVRRRGSGTFVTSDPFELNRRIRIGFFALFYNSSCYVQEMLCSLWMFSKTNRCDLIPVFREAGEIEEAVAEYGLDGVLIFNSNEIPPELVKHLRAKGTPALLLSSVQKGASEFSIGYSNERIIEDAVDHLASLGHRRIGFLVVSLNSLPSTERYNSFMAAMWKRQLPVNPAWTVTDATRERLGGYFSAPERPTAVIIGNRLLARDVCETLTALGIAVPRELSIFCIDEPDHPERLSPKLSLFRIDVQGFCRQGAQSLLRQIRNEPPLHSEERNYEFVDAGSCAPPPQN
ncbi:MAG: substrate-binding domain-containing protein [Lentisphaeria bacterium]|nr:substrate-binding domain-containing protein [Lentisphaeria bacterium]